MTYTDPATGQWVGEYATRDDIGEVHRRTEWFATEGEARHFERTGQQHPPPPSMLYHATPFHAVYAIRRAGLTSEPDHPVHLSVFDRRDFIAALHLVPLADVALLRVDVRGLHLLPGWDGEGSYAYPGTIGPDRIELVG